MWEIGILLYLCHVHFLSTWYMWTRPEPLKIAPVVSSLLKPIFLQKPRFTFFVIVFPYISARVALQILNTIVQSNEIKALTKNIA